jgi:GNAT superfamily N-acetyltransferase
MQRFLNAVGIFDRSRRVGRRQVDIAGLRSMLRLDPAGSGFGIERSGHWARFSTVISPGVYLIASCRREQVEILRPGGWTGRGRGAMPEPLGDIERAIARAWPADETSPIGGWLWRSSGGGYGRANSVATLGCPGDVGAAIEEVEARYWARRQPALIQVTDASEPRDLGQRLLSRGYRVSDENATLVRRLEPRSGAVHGSARGDLSVEISEDATADWLGTYGTVLDDSRRASAPRILARVPWPRRLIGVRRAGCHCATTLLVADGPIAVVECVATRAEARRSGAARLAMDVAIEQARDLGAGIMALGMVAANQPARGLYEGLGFVEVGRSRYFERTWPSG